MVADVAPALAVEEIQRSHCVHHCGVDKTMYLIGLSHPEATVLRTDVEAVVKQCRRCQSIDPVSVHFDKGSFF
jgi:hypothetical protein